MTEKLLLKLPEVAERLNVTRSRVYGLVRDGKIRSVKLGKRGVRVPPEAVDEYVAKLIRESAA